MTILVVPSWYKTDSNPILGSFFREQAMMLKEAGEKVIVADATFQGREDYFSKRCFKLKKYDDDGLLTYSYVVPALGAFKTKDGGSERYYRNLKRIYKKITSDGHKIDLIHAHSYLPAGVAAVKLGKEENIPVIVTEHASAVLEKQLTTDRIKLLKEVVSETKEFVCVSKALKKSVQELTDNIREPIVIPNAVDSRFKFQREKNTDCFTFISIGNLVKSKRFDLTIEAFASCFKTNYKVKLKILGDGVLRKELEELVREYGIEEQVLFEGRVAREVVVEELQKANVFVLPSDYETFGVVYIEAMACGVPVIGTKNGGAEDIISYKNGLLIEKNSVSLLAEAMMAIYKEHRKFNCEEIAKECQQLYGQKVIREKILQTYVK